MKPLRRIHLASLLDILIQLEKDGVEYVDISGKKEKRNDRCYIDVWDDYFHPDILPGSIKIIGPLENEDNLENLIG